MSVRKDVVQQLWDISARCATARDCCSGMIDSNSVGGERYWRGLADRWHMEGIKFHRLAGVAILCPEAAEHFLRVERGV